MRLFVIIAFGKKIWIDIFIISGLLNFKRR